MFTYKLLLNWTDELEAIRHSAIPAPDRTFWYQAYYRVDEEAETTGAGKTSPEIIDVDATTLKTPTATTEAHEERESTEDVSSKKGRKFGRQSSDKSTKWCHKSCSTGLAAGALIIVLVYSS